jgi:hypothetical protein
VITVLAAVRDAISIDLLMIFTGIRDRGPVSDALETWTPFLRSIEVRFEEETKECFRIYQASFLNFVTTRGEVDLMQAHRNIAESLIKPRMALLPSREGCMARARARS